MELAPSEGVRPRKRMFFFFCVTALAAILAWMLFGGEAEDVLFFEKKKKTRVLYVLTSSSKYKRGRDRIKETMIPVLEAAVNSYSTKYHVDVYLILSYDLTEAQHVAIREALPKRVGLQVWSDAMPFDYAGCNKNLDKTPFEEWNTTICRDKPIRAISEVDVALARQHRYVMKDKLPHYDVFISLEDDMRVTRHHVETHMRTMEHIRTNNSSSFRLTKKHLERIRPGFVRVEVLQSQNSKSRVQPISESSNAIAKSIPLDAAAPSIDPSWCCGTRSPNVTAPSVDDIVAWETAIESLGVVEIGTKWYVVLPGTREKKIPNHWAGGQPPDPFDPNYLAQPASWIMSRDELLQAHTDLCDGSFLPPYQAPTYHRNGLWRNNVEFWSGGIQMWCGSCNIVRVIELDRFSRHLVYHTANNKQYDIPKAERLVRMNELHAQLHSVVADAKMKIGGVSK